MNKKILCLSGLIAITTHLQSMQLCTYLLQRLTHTTVISNTLQCNFSSSKSSHLKKEIARQERVIKQQETAFYNSVMRIKKETELNVAHKFLDMQLFLLEQQRQTLKLKMLELEAQHALYPAQAYAQEIKDLEQKILEIQFKKR